MIKVQLDHPNGQVTSESLNIKVTKQLGALGRQTVGASGITKKLLKFE